jgi:hypothetical protein
MRKVLVVFLLVCTLAAQAPTPRIGWRKVIDEGIVVNAMETRWVNLEQVRFTEYLRSQARERGVRLKTPVHVEIRSGSGVTFAIVTVEPGSQRVVFDGAACFTKNITSFNSECLLPKHPAFLAIKDSRGAGTALSTLFSRGRNADTLAAQNKVTIRVYRADCLENCPNWWHD